MEDSWLREEDFANDLDLLWAYKLGMGFDLLDLLLTSGAGGTSRVMPYTMQAHFYKRVSSAQGMFLKSWAEQPGARDFFCCLLIGLSPFTLRLVIL